MAHKLVKQTPCKIRRKWLQVWWCSSPQMTFRITVEEDETIVDTAPIAYKFRGQPFSHLKQWLSRQARYQDPVLFERIN